VFTDLESARVKLVLPGARNVECEVPAERATRSIEGEIPVLRWLRARDGKNGFALASDVLAACDLENGDLRVTLARATRYARAENLDQSKEWWRPTTDRGELRERLVLLPPDAPVEQTADLLTQPPLTLQIWENRTGNLPATGTLARLTPDTVELLALKPAATGAGIEVRLRNPTNQPVRPVLTLAGPRHAALGTVAPGEIATFRLGRSGTKRVLVGG
jgi:alpha-mannosidase